MRIRISTFLLLAAACSSLAVNGEKKSERRAAQQIQTDITYLASDELEGRRTGTEGERKAVEYIEARYKKLKIGGYNGQYRYPFHFTYGREIAKSSTISINGAVLRLEDEAFPLPFSATQHVAGEVLPEVTEQGNIWMVPIYADREQANDPHFDAEKHMYEAAKEAKKGGASGVVFFDNFGSKYEPSFSKQSENETLDIPVVCLKHEAYSQHVVGKGPKTGVPVDLNVAINRPERTGNNVAAYLDNKAKYTVVVGAHLDHLGYGEDGNSLFANAIKEHQIHHGADDNASGTAALMEVAKWVKSKKLKHFNYLFIHFSGEELGLYGSKAFVKDQKVDSANVAYMVNMDMVGRLNDSTHSLSVGGVGTSPSWAEVVNMGGKEFKINIDSSGVGPSDHTSFYNAGIPVLFFFTGTHKDYHKPSDKADLINYKGEVAVIKYAEEVLAKMDKEKVKPAYTVTRQTSTGGRSKFKVTLGIMPDYSYHDGGLRVDGVSDNKPAAKAGLKAGDIITQLGDVNVLSIQSYMEALGSLSPGQKTVVKLKRDGKEISLPVELGK